MDHVNMSVCAALRTEVWFMAYQAGIVSIWVSYDRHCLHTGTWLAKF